MLTGFELTPAAPLDEREQRVCRQGRDDRYAWPSDSRVIEVAASLGTARAHATRDCACSESAAQQTWRAVRSRTSRRAGTERATTASAPAPARASLCLCHACDHAVGAALTIASVGTATSALRALRRPRRRRRALSPRIAPLTKHSHGTYGGDAHRIADVAQVALVARAIARRVAPADPYGRRARRAVRRRMCLVRVR